MNAFNFKKNMKRSRVIHTEPTLKEKKEYMSSWKPIKLGSGKGGLFGIVKGFRHVKRIRFYSYRLIINLVISSIPIIVGVLVPLLLIYSIVLSIVVFIIVGFVIKPFRVTEIDLEDYDLK